MSVKELLSEFDLLADEKLELKRVKYGKLNASVPVKLLNEHLLEEFAEWIYAVYGDNSKYGVVRILEELTKIVKDEKSRDVVTELFDLRNMARIIYMCGKTQGVF